MSLYTQYGDPARPQSINQLIQLCRITGFHEDFHIRPAAFDFNPKSTQIQFGGEISYRESPTRPVFYKIIYRSGADNLTLVQDLDPVADHLDF